MLDSLLDEDDSAGILYSDDILQCQRLGNDIWLIITGADHAGAITPSTGASLLKALSAVSHSHEQDPARTLRFSFGNAAGGDVAHPMESLYLINTILEMLWQLRAKKLRLQITIDGGCYGGSAITFAACADEILMGDTTAMALLGPRVLNAFSQTLSTQIPGNNFHTDHLRFRRITHP